MGADSGQCTKFGKYAVWRTTQGAAMTLGQICLDEKLLLIKTAAD
jgi:hypothetical protein